MDLSALDRAERLYLRPIHFIESPQQHDGESARLAGTMLWFCAVELIERNDGEITRRIVRVSEWEAVAATLPERASRIYANLTGSRAALQMGMRTIRLDQPQVMGILNVTPDSFSDGGKHVDAAVAVSAGVAMAAAGAALIDVGGEFTSAGRALALGRRRDYPDRSCHQRAGGGRNGDIGRYPQGCGDGGGACGRRWDDQRYLRLAL